MFYYKWNVLNFSGKEYYICGIFRKLPKTEEVQFHFRNINLLGISLIDLDHVHFAYRWAVLVGGFAMFLEIGKYI